MGRKRQKKYPYPMPVGMRARVQKSGKTWYYLDLGGKPRKEVALGSIYADAIRKWAELVSPAASELPNAVTFSWLASEYNNRVVPTKALRTQKDNRSEIQSLLAFFTSGGDAPIDEIRPQHVAQFLEWRSKTAPVRANREKALLSHMFNWARQLGYIDGANPCAGIKGNTEMGRSIYVSDELLAHILQDCDIPTSHALRLMYLTGQRKSDVLGMQWSHVHGDVLHVKQAKTQASIRIRLDRDDGSKNELGALLGELLGFQEQCGASPYLLVTETGQALSDDTLRSRYDSARTACAKRLQKIGRLDLAKEVAQIQMRDLRAKSATDIENDTGSSRLAQLLMAHKNHAMTEHYIRKRQGAKVNPTR
jgi:integrase